jgi:hypothetical protein
MIKIPLTPFEWAAILGVVPHLCDPEKDSFRKL